MEKDGSIHDCSTKKENEDLKCALFVMAQSGAQIVNLSKIVIPQAVSPLCICQKCEQLEDPFVLYKKAVIEKFPMINLKI